MIDMKMQRINHAKNFHNTRILKVAMSELEKFKRIEE